MPTTFRLVPLTLAFLVVACASAAERLEEGAALQAEGRWEEAADRYVDALEKEDTLSEARRGLQVVADSAVAVAIREAATRGRAGDSRGAAEAYLGIDALVGRTRAVGVTPARPQDFDRMRRSALDAAIDEAMAEGRGARREGRWAEARRDFRRVARFDPDARQEGEARRAEADLLVAWAEAELEEGRPRRAFDVAEESLALRAPGDVEAAGRARALQGLAIERGTRFLAALPVSAVARVGAMSATDFAVQLDDVLEIEHWRRPPPFVASIDGATVRREVRRQRRRTLRDPERPLSDRQVRAVLDELGADYGALLELQSVTRSEERVRRSEREARDGRGRQVTYWVEEGRYRYEARLQVLLLDADGREVAESTVEVTHEGDFERGVYEGDASALRLGRNEARLFDADVLRRRIQDIQDELLEKLAARVAAQVFDGVLEQIP